MKAAAIVLALSAFTTAAFGQLAPGTVAATRTISTACVEPCISVDQVTWFSNTGAPLQRAALGSDFSRAGTPAIDSLSRLVVPFSSNQKMIRFFAAGGQQNGDIPAPAYYGAAVSADGNTIYVVGPASGFFSGTPDTLFVLDRSGNILHQYPWSGLGAAMIPTGQPLDLAPDQCTLFSITADQHVARFNACSGQALTPWNSAAGVRSVRALADGGVLAAARSSLAILDANGQVARQVPLPAPAQFSQAIAFDINPNYLWMGSIVASERPLLLKLRLADGSIVSSTDDDRQGGVVGLAVYGETRPTLAQAVAVNVPALSTWLLVALGVAFAGLALLRSR